MLVSWDGLCRFQSTLPARGATVGWIHLTLTVKFQSTLPARGATHAGALDMDKIIISIHAPREGSDHNYYREGGTP